MVKSDFPSISKKFLSVAPKQYSHLSQKKQKKRYSLAMQTPSNPPTVLNCGLKTVSNELPVGSGVYSEV